MRGHHLLGKLTPELESILGQIFALAEANQTEPRQLLQILRALEGCHREITDRLFVPALPNSRHPLFDLLLDIESEGGWPYIYRVKLHEILDKLKETP